MLLVILMTTLSTTSMAANGEGCSLDEHKMTVKLKSQVRERDEEITNLKKEIEKLKREIAVLNLQNGQQ